MKNKMWTQLLVIAGVIFGWFALQRWVQPAMGIRT
jgi:hypothetical protein